MLVLLALPAWRFRQYIGSYFSNDIGAPEVTEELIDIRPESETPQLIRLAVAGDVGTGDVEAYRTAEVMDSLDEQFDFAALLLLGDNIYPEGEIDQLQEKVIDPFAPVLDGRTKLLPVLGNHDVDNGYRDAQIEAFGLPGAWYSEMVGRDTLVIGLDSNQAENPEQLLFLESVLAGDRPRWTIVTMHHPAFSAGHHGDELAVQNNFVPLFERYGVAVVFAGHDHDYQRTIPINGTTYIVTGAAAKLRPAGRNELTAVSWSTYSFVDLAIYPDRILGQAIDHSGRAIDTFEIR